MWGKRYNFLLLLLLSLWSPLVSNFIIPLHYRGNWSPFIKDRSLLRQNKPDSESGSDSIFIIKDRNISAAYNGGLIGMNIRNGSLFYQGGERMELILEEPIISPIPKKPNLSRLWRAISFLQSVKKEGLKIIVCQWNETNSEAESKEILEIEYKTGEFSGKFLIQKKEK